MHFTSRWGGVAKMRANMRWDENRYLAAGDFKILDSLSESPAGSDTFAAYSFFTKLMSCLVF
jgi:hypothetical protein